MISIKSTLCLSLPSLVIFAQGPSQKAEASIKDLAERFGKSINLERAQDIKSMCPKCLMGWTLRNTLSLGMTESEYEDCLNSVVPVLNKGKVTDTVARELMVIWAVFAWQLSDQEISIESIKRAKQWVDDIVPNPSVVKKGVSISQIHSSTSKVSWSSWKPK